MYNLRNRELPQGDRLQPRRAACTCCGSSQALKTAKYAGTEAPRLAGKEIALIFEKSSTRTRCAFEVAAFDQGAHVTYLDPTGSQMGHKESIADTARVLGRMFDAIEYRGSAQANVEELAAHAGVPVYNGLTNEWHPTQMLADFLTMHERPHKPYDELAYAFVGDGRYNMGRSLLVMGAIMGSDVRFITPAGARPAGGRRRRSREELAADSGARSPSADDSARPSGADFVHTDVWVSMGEPKDVWTERATLLAHTRSTRAAGRHRQPEGEVHALPAGLPRRETTVGARDRRGDRDDERARGDRRRLPLAGQHRLRPGREPPAHDQGRARRHARVTPEGTIGPDGPLAVVALGGNALLQRGQESSAANQHAAAMRAARILGPVSERARLVTHGNGPQVGLLALKEDAYGEGEPYPLDVLDAESGGQIGYVIELELDNAIDHQHTVAVITRVLVDADDPAFSEPTKFIGPVYDEDRARALADERGWSIKPDGDRWRRVVPSPQPREIIQLAAISRLVDAGFLVVCVGGGGVPVVATADGHEGVEAVIDKDLASALLAIGLSADVLVLATDVDAVYLDFGGPEQRPIDRTTPAALRDLDFADWIDGPEGRSRVPLRGGDRRPRCDRNARRTRWVDRRLPEELRSPEAQSFARERSHDRRRRAGRVSTLELFFDLVFVFTITQLTSVLVARAELEGRRSRRRVMLGVIFWMYGGYAWLTNAVAVDRLARRLALLAGMAGFLVVALDGPGRRSAGSGATFGLAYLAVVVIHLGDVRRSTAAERWSPGDHRPRALQRLHRAARAGRRDRSAAPRSTCSGRSAFLGRVDLAAPDRRLRIRDRPGSTSSSATASSSSSPSASRWSRSGSAPPGCRSTSSSSSPRCSASRSAPACGGRTSAASGGTPSDAMRSGAPGPSGRASRSTRSATASGCSFSA